MDKKLVFLSKNSNDIFCVTDINGNIISVNQSWVHASGYTERKSKASNLVDLSHPDDQNSVENLQQHCFTTIY